MTVDDVYDRYSVPMPLRLHMLRTAGVASLIADHWIGPPLGIDDMLPVLLVHDIGNIAKMAPSEPNAAEQQAAFVRRYGQDDHEASHAVGAELGLSPEELRLMDAKVFVRNDETASSNDFTLKVAAYADQRVAPDGVMPLIARLEEARERYSDKPGSSMNNPRTPMLIDCARTIEAQLAEHLAPSVQ